MKSYLILIFIIFINLSNHSVMAKGKKEIKIIPTPQIEKVRDGNFSMIGKMNLFIPENVQLNSAVFELHNAIDEYPRLSFTEIDNVENAKIVFELDPKLDFSEYTTKFLDEAYVLDIGKELITIKARSSKGLFYGAMSLVQLIENSNNNLIKSRRIIDWPDMGIRGISDDISRGQVSTMDNFKRIIRFISKYKMNTYMPYLEDMLKFEKYPSIGKSRGALNKKEVKELVDFAGQYFVDVVPIFQTLGHYENILSLPEFVKYAEFPGAASLSVSEDATYEFLENMLEEVFEMFPSKNFHMGADESWDVGLGKSKRITDETSLAIVHAEHYKKVYDICKKHGKEVFMYGDVILNHPDILELIPKDITIVDWHYAIKFKYPSAEKFDDAGFKYIVSPSVWNYLTTYPVYVNSVPNIKNIVKSGLENNSIGMINSNWGDFGAETFKELILPGYAWSAQCSWNYDDSDIAVFNNSFLTNFYGTSDESVHRLHNTFSNQLNQMLWHDVWRHPLLPFRGQTWWQPYIAPPAKLEWMRNSIDDLKNDLILMKSRVKQNKQQIPILEFLTNLNQWYIFKVETQVKLFEAINDSSKLQDCLEDVEKNISMLNELKPIYEKIWLTYYEPENLNMVLDKFNRLIAYFEETKEQIKSGKLVSPDITSKWIYYQTDEENFASKAEFNTSINLSGDVKSAKFQLLGDTYAKLFINNEFVDEVFVRRSLSLYTEYKRIKYMDVSSYLKSGDNELKVIVESFNRKPHAGFNLIGEIVTDNETVNLISDENWKVKNLESDGGLINAVVKEYPYPVIQPNFKTDRTSWIER
jgi:hypothetical protein